MAKYEIKDGVGIIPEGTTRIEAEAFYDCKELTSIVIPKSVRYVDSLAFYGCTNLKTIVFDDSIEVIECKGQKGVWETREYKPFDSILDMFVNKDRYDCFVLCDDERGSDPWR